MARNEGSNPTSDFVDAIVKDPGNPPQVMLLQGFPGNSSEAKHRRIYLDPALGSYLDIPQDAILHSQELPKESSPLGGVLLWVKQSAEIKQGPSAEKQGAQFLRGQIQQDFLQGAAGAAPGQAAIASMLVVCRQITHQVFCPQTQLLICSIACASLPPQCRLTQILYCGGGGGGGTLPPVSLACGGQGGFGDIYGAMGVGAPQVSPQPAISQAVCYATHICPVATHQIYCRPSQVVICTLTCPTNPIHCQISGTPFCGGGTLPPVSLACGQGGFGDIYGAAGGAAAAGVGAPPPQVSPQFPITILCPITHAQFCPVATHQVYCRPSLGIACTINCPTNPIHCQVSGSPYCGGGGTLPPVSIACGGQGGFGDIYGAAGGAAAAGVGAAQLSPQLTVSQAICYVSQICPVATHQFFCRPSQVIICTINCPTNPIQCQVSGSPYCGGGGTLPPVSIACGGQGGFGDIYGVAGGAAAAGVGAAQASPQLAISQIICPLTQACPIATHQIFCRPSQVIACTINCPTNPIQCRITGSPFCGGGGTLPPVSLACGGQGGFGDFYGAAGGAAAAGVGAAQLSPQLTISQAICYVSQICPVATHQFFCRPSQVVICTINCPTNPIQCQVSGSPYCGGGGTLPPVSIACGGQGGFGDIYGAAGGAAAAGVGAPQASPQLAASIFCPVTFAQFCPVATHQVYCRPSILVACPTALAHCQISLVIYCGGGGGGGGTLPPVSLACGGQGGFGDIYGAAGGAAAAGVGAPNIVATPAGISLGHPCVTGAACPLPQTHYPLLCHSYIVCATQPIVCPPITVQHCPTQPVLCGPVSGAAFCGGGPVTQACGAGGLGGGPQVAG
ncbi:MAG TPA: hypothetical protein VG675_16215 [Bryobacteraceae bacterium]|nr:hypothetical protein [Bryobacteraceae bacterium]